MRRLLVGLLLPVDALIGLGTARFELGRYAAAIEPLEDALRRTSTLLGPEGPQAAVRAKVAWSLYYLGRYEGALATFDRALRAVPDSRGLQNGLGWCYLRLGDHGRARTAFRRALELRPDYEDAREGLRQAGG
jgi:tetratricopeptide (TPR) repeat protein